MQPTLCTQFKPFQLYRRRDHQQIPFGTMDSPLEGHTPSPCLIALPDRLATRDMHAPLISNASMLSHFVSGSGCISVPVVAGSFNLAGGRCLSVILHLEHTHA